MDASFTQEWVLKAVRSGLLDPAAAAEVLRNDPYATKSLGRLTRATESVKPPQALRTEIRQLTLRGLSADEWAGTLVGDADPAGRLPNAIVIEAPTQTDPVATYQGLRALVCAWLDRATRADRLRLVWLQTRPDPVGEAVAALFSSLNAEEHTVSATVLTGQPGEAAVASALHETGGVEAQRRYRDGEVVAWATRVEELRLPGTPTKLRQGGRYLITGGLGSLGFALARHLARSYAAELILTGTRPAEQAEARLAELRELGATVRYRRVDFTAPDAASSLASELSGLDRLDGVVHCAGTTRDSLLRSKPAAAADAVIKPKTDGVRLLDQASAEFELDFFVTYSSISALLGNVGQTDYAFANAYLDGYIQRRCSAVERGERHGTSVSIAWPFWSEGGITIPRDSLDRLAATTGIEPLPTWLGIALFEAALSLGEPLIAPVVGDPTTWEVDPVNPATTAAVNDDDQVRARFVDYLLDTFAEVYEIPRDSLRADANLQSYGLDSVLIGRLSSRLVTIMPQLGASVFFDCATVAEIADSLWERHLDQIRAHFASAPAAPAQPAAAVEPSTEQVPAGRSAAQPSACEPMRIAIVGYAARMAQADTAAEVWTALSEGADLVTAFPAQRREVFEGSASAGFALPGITEQDWMQPGSYLDDVWGFDASFFGVGAREARSMDPQERLALESAWHAFEDAGIAPRAAKAATDGSIGVFGALTSHTHQQLGAYGISADSYAPQAYGWSMANRLSSFFDFNGPSETLDTACSSGLYALARACESLRREECRMAVVCAANLYLHPHKFAMLRERAMLSGSGRCHTFGAAADGFVPAEALVTLVLKPLADAERDGDRIRGVVWSWGLNHAGTTNGYTVPSPKAQAAVIRQALTAGGLDGSEVSYVEAHGTGTSLGDPIEIEGLIDVFGSRPERSTRLGVGSVKSNYGHAEAAAGLVSIVKVLKQLEHDQLVPSIHAAEKNPRLQLAQTPLYIVESRQPWRDAPGQPRFAGVSSFGAGGSNAHVILRSPGEPGSNQEPSRVSGAQPLAADRQKLPFLFSAADRTALGKLLTSHLTWLSTRNVDLAALAAALIHERTPLAERTCVFAADQAELLARLEIAARDDQAPGVDHGSARDQSVRQGRRDPMVSPADATRAGDWLAGAEVDWQLAQPAGEDRLDLPLYPFQHRDYHVTVPAATSPQPRAASDAAISPAEPAAAPAPAPVTGPAGPVAAPPLQRLDFLADIPQGSYGARELNDPVVRTETPEPGILVLRMHNQDNSNLVDTPLYTELARAFDQVNRDDSVKVVVLTGTDRLFCMGGTSENLDEIAKRDSTCSDGSLFYLGLPSVRVPVISAMSGHAHGGGLTFGLSADIPILAEESLYAASFMNINFTPGGGSTYYFGRRFGEAIAREMFFTGRDYTGRELKQLNPALRVVPKSQVMPAALQIARAIAAKSLRALMLFKAGNTDAILQELAGFIQREDAMQQELFDDEHIRTARQDIQRLFGAEIAEPADQHALSQTAAPKPSQATSPASGGPVVLAATARPETAATSQPNKDAAVVLRPVTAAQAASAANPQAAAPAPVSSVPQPAPEPSAAAAGSPDSDRAALVTAVLAELGEVLKEDPAELDLRRSVSELGVDSVGALELVQRLNSRFATNLETDVIYTYPRAIDLAQGVAERLGHRAAPDGSVTTEAAQPASERPSSAPAAGTPSHPGPGVAVTRDELLRVAPDASGQAGPREQFTRILQSILRFADDDLPDLRRNFQDLGIDSVSGLELIREVNLQFGTALQASDLYAYGSALDFVAQLDGGRTTVASVLPAELGQPRPTQSEEGLQAVLARLGQHDLSVEDVLEILERG